MVNSPCIGKCTFDITIMNCNDCGRNKEEISKWYIMTDEEKLKVLERINNERCNGFCGEHECNENQSWCKRKVQTK